MSQRRTIKDMPAEMRPRERLERDGPSALSNAELLAILLRTGSTEETVLELASRLLAEHGGLRGLVDATLEELCETKGVGQAKAVEVRSAMELAKRIAASGVERGDAIKGAEDVSRLMMPRLRYLPKESLFVLILNTKHQLIEEVPVSLGTVEESLANPREIFREAIRRNGVAIILVHNHPSGDPSPSKDDISITQQVCEAGEVVDIRVLDHIVIGDGCYVSMRQQELAEFR